MTREEIGQIVETVSILDYVGEAINIVREDICPQCLDRRCKAGKICKEFHQRTRLFTWEIVARSAELN